jgi:hypothetical protein
MAMPKGRLASEPIVATFSESQIAVHSCGENPLHAPSAKTCSTRDAPAPAYIQTDIA